MAGIFKYFFPQPLTAIQQLQAELDALPPGTTRLDLSNRGLTTETLAGVRFPDSILELNLRENRIDSLDGVVFPDRLRMIDLERNNIQVVTEANFPQSLRILYINHNPVFNRMGRMINRRGLRYRAEADDHHFLALPDDVYRQRYLEDRRPIAASPPLPIPDDMRVSEVRIARTYQDYITIMTAEGATEKECHDAVCATCWVPFVVAHRLEGPVLFHETYRHDGRSMWSHPCHLSDMAQIQENRYGGISCPECRTRLNITPQQVQAIAAASTIQRVVRGHQSRKRTKKPKTNTKSGGKKRKQRKQKQKRTVKKT